MKLKVQLTLLFVLLLIHKINTLENNKPIADTKLGRIKGSLMETRLGKTIYSFRGIYYAESPTGQLRFKPPVPVKPWSGVFDASKEGPACIQKKGIGLSENCLTLNIYTKQLNGTKKSPVIVFITTGAFTKNSGQSFLFGPRYLLDHDVVLVTFNYRLSSLGFLNTGDKYAPGNMAFKDQVLVLKFVRDYIAAFGGDPKSVTLTGQSAGSRSIILHLVSPMSRGLFHRAIGLSGSMTTPIPPQRQQIKLAKKQAELFNCTTVTTKEMVECLMKKPAQEFGGSVPLFQEWNNNPSLIWYPSVEPEIPGMDRFLTDEPEKLLSYGKINAVPLIIGVTKDEYSFKVAGAVKQATQGNDTYFRELTNYWDKLAPICFQYERDTERSKYISNQLYQHYFSDQPISLNNSNILRQLFANIIVHWPVYKAATLLAKHMSEPVYFYEFTYRSPYSRYAWDDTNKPTGVAHGDDLQYIFNIENNIYSPSTGFPLYNDSDPEIIMVKRLTSIWAHFAKTSEPLPNNPEIFGNVTWKRFSPENKSYLNIGKNLVLKNNFLVDTMRFLDRLFS